MHFGGLSNLRAAAGHSLRLVSRLLCRPARIELVTAAVALALAGAACSNVAEDALGGRPRGGSDWAYPPKPGGFLFGWFREGTDLSNDARFQEGHGEWCQAGLDGGCAPGDGFAGDHGPNCWPNTFDGDDTFGCWLGDILDPEHETEAWAVSSLAGNQAGAILGGFALSKNSGQVAVRGPGAAAGRIIDGFQSDVNAVTAPDGNGDFYVGLSSGHIDMCNIDRNCDNMPIYATGGDVYALAYDTHTGELWGGLKDGSIVYCPVLNWVQRDSCRTVADTGAPVTDIALSPAGNALAVTRAGRVVSCNAARGEAGGVWCRDLFVPGLPASTGPVAFNVETMTDPVWGVTVGVTATSYGKLKISDPPILGQAEGTLYMFPEGSPREVIAAAAGRVGMNNTGSNLASDGEQFFIYVPLHLPGDSQDAQIYRCGPRVLNYCQQLTAGDAAYKYAYAEETWHTSQLASVGGTPGTPPSLSSP